MVKLPVKVSNLFFNINKNFKNFKRKHFIFEMFPTLQDVDLYLNCNQVNQNQFNNLLTSENEM